MLTQFDCWTQMTYFSQIVRLYRVSERPNTGRKGHNQAWKAKTRPKGTKGDKRAISSHLSLFSQTHAWVSRAASHTTALNIGIIIFSPEKAKIRPTRPNSNVMVWFWPFRGKTVEKLFAKRKTKTVFNVTFIVDFQGQIGQKGHKGYLFSPVFFSPGLAWRSRVSVVRVESGNK